MSKVEKVLAEVLEAMQGKTGSATLHFKDGRLLKVEYRTIQNAGTTN